MRWIEDMARASASSRCRAMRSDGKRCCRTAGVDHDHETAAEYLARLGPTGPPLVSCVRPQSVNEPVEPTPDVVPDVPPPPPETVPDVPPPDESHVPDAATNVRRTRRPFDPEAARARAASEGIGY